MAVRVRARGSPGTSSGTGAKTGSSPIGTPWTRGTRLSHFLKKMGKPCYFHHFYPFPPTSLNDASIHSHRAGTGLEMILLFVLKTRKNSAIITITSAAAPATPLLPLPLLLPQTLNRASAKGASALCLRAIQHQRAPWQPTRWVRMTGPNHVRPWPLYTSGERGESVSRWCFGQNDHHGKERGGNREAAEEAGR